MLAPQYQQIVLATVPALQKHGEEITRVFYKQMLEAHPELNTIFNAEDQATGVQAKRLAASILAYAANIEKLENLGTPLDKIAHRHVELKVQPEQYPIVGEHLLLAIRAVLGDAATPEVLEAWGAAYNQLADIMIEREKALYAGV